MNVFKHCAAKRFFPQWRIHYPLRLSKNGTALCIEVYCFSLQNFQSSTTEQLQLNFERVAKVVKKFWSSSDPNPMVAGFAGIVIATVYRTYVNSQSSRISLPADYGYLSDKTVLRYCFKSLADQQLTTEEHSDKVDVNVLVFICSLFAKYQF